jgi:hypothetical protein
VADPEHLPLVGDVVTALRDAGFEPVLVGGMALVILGSLRVTRDFDFLIAEANASSRSLREPAGPSWLASYSRRFERDVEKLRRCLPVLKPLGNHAQGQSLHLGHGLMPVSAVAHSARQGGHLGKPPAVGFPFELDGEGHERNVPPGPAAQQAVTADGGRCDHGPSRLNRERYADKTRIDQN